LKSENGEFKTNKSIGIFAGLPDCLSEKALLQAARR